MSAQAPRVLVTRAAEDAPTLAHALSEAGLQPIVVPAILRQFKLAPVIELAAHSAHADLLVVTSATVADVIALAAPEGWRTCEVAAVGGATQRRLQALGWPVHHVPEQATADSLVEMLGDVSGLTIAWPRANLADPRTADRFRAGGAIVHECVAYTNVAPPEFSGLLASALPVDCTTATSGSAVRRLAEQVPESQRWKLGRVVVIGPTTRSAAKEVGLPVHAMAVPHSVSGLVTAVSDLFGGLR